MARCESSGWQVAPVEWRSGGSGGERESSAAVSGAGIVAVDVRGEAECGVEWRERERESAGGREGEIGEQPGGEPDPKTCRERGAARCGQCVGVSAAEGVANASAEHRSGGERAADGEFSREAGAAEVARDEHGEGVQWGDEQERGSGRGQGAASDGTIVDNDSAGATRDAFVPGSEADDIADPEPVWEQRRVGVTIGAGSREAQSDSDPGQSGECRQGCGRQ